MEQNKNPETHEDRQTLVRELEQASGDETSAVLEAIRKYDDPKHEDLAREMYALARRTGLESTNVSDRHLVTDYFLEKVVESTGYLRGLALRFLQEFRKEDFSEAGRERIRALVEKIAEPDLLRVAGIAEVRGATDVLEKLAASPLPERSSALQVSVAWQATLALARMGDDSSARRAAARVAGEPDTVLRSTVLFHDLAFTRHPISFAKLVEFLDSNQRRPTLKETQAEGYSEGAAAAEVLSAHLVGAPVLDDLPEEQRVPTIKAWLAKQSSLPIAR